MQPYKLSKDSWHYKLVTNRRWGKGDDSYFTYGVLSSHDIDFCEYFRALCGSLIFIAFITAFGSFIGAATGDGLAWLFSGLVHGFVPISALGGVFWFILILVSLLGFIAFIGYGICKVNIPSIPLVAITWHKFRDKVCVKITFEDIPHE